MNTNGVFLLGAATGAMLGFSATFRARNALRILTGTIVGAALVALTLGLIAMGAEWLAGWVKTLGIAAGAAIGTVFGGVASYVLGVLGIAFFGFLFRPERGVMETLRASSGRGAIIVAVIGGFFGGLSGAVIGALKDSGLL